MTERERELCRSSYAAQLESLGYGPDGTPKDKKTAWPEWISVKDRLPETKENPLTMDFQEVICFCDFGGRPKRTDVRTYGFGQRSWEKEPHFLHGQQIMDGVVTHWMPLPEPPKEG